MNSKSQYYFKRFFFSTFLFILISWTSIGCHSILSQDKDIEAGYVKIEEVVLNDEVSQVYISDTINPSKSEKLSLVSWNIQYLGRTKTSEDIYEIANILRDFDIVAIQEVVAKDPAGAQAVAKIADELNRMGYKWDYQISDPTKSPTVYISERYAYLWKTSKVSLSYRYASKNQEQKTMNLSKTIPSVCNQTAS